VMDCSFYTEMSRKLVCRRDHRVFRYFVVSCNNCDKYETSLGDINIHRQECGSASFSMTCGCCNQLYTNWIALTTHSNEVFSHKRLQDLSLSMSTSSGFHTDAANTPPLIPVPSPSSQFFNLQPPSNQIGQTQPQLLSLMEKLLLALTTVMCVQLTRTVR